MSPTTDAPLPVSPTKELLRDARTDYRMCVASGLIDASPADWDTFLAGYADQAEFYILKDFLTHVA